MRQVNRVDLCGLSTTRFMSQYWQKRPLLVRGAFKNFSSTLEPFQPADVLALVTRDDAESRLVQHEGRQWQLDHGPFLKRDLARLGPRDWTVLVQDTQHFSRAAQTLLGHFDFIPHARVDDLMVSLAAPGGGVGAHVDSYDVFLIQGKGRRRWRISSQKDLAFKPGLPLKILARFKPEEEWVLESGDMLYLPPGYAHDGVALDECLTYSVGFRAPLHQEWLESFVDQLRDGLCVDGQYADPGLKPTDHPGRLPAELVRGLTGTLKSLAWNRDFVEEATGRFMTEPKAHVSFEPPDKPITLATLRKAAARHGLRLDGRTRMTYNDKRIFANGEVFALPESGDAELRSLADQRCLPPGKPAAAAEPLLLQWLNQGFLHVDHD
jgi:50S ribosomal protein L16 3-hydroxylase